MSLSQKVKKLTPYLVALAAGSLMTLGFAPYYVSLCPIISCFLLLVVLRKHSPTRALLLGWLYGLAMFGSGIYWIYVSIHDYGNAAPPLAFLITGLFVAGMALYPALLGYVLNRYFPSPGLIRNLLAFPALWVLFEIIRGWFLTGFPWLYVGYGEMDNNLVAFAPIGGVWLVSWITVLFSALCYSLAEYYYDNKRKPLLRNGIILSMVAIWLSAYGVGKVTWVALSPRTLDVTLAQGNVPQLMRWDPEHVNNIIRTYQQLTSQIGQHELIIWPEASIPLPLPLSAPLFTRLSNSLQAQNSALIAGVPTEAPDGEHFYNSLIAVGDTPGLYHKSHMVPFGEYVPFEKQLRGLIGFFDLPMSSMIPGERHQNNLKALGFEFAPAICYEIAYPSYVQHISKKADFILTVSNDAWFGTSIGPAQHLEIAQFRALENGRYVLRATNTGFTAIIDPFGQIVSISPQFTESLLKGTVATVTGQTPWSRYGVLPLFVALITVLLLAWVLRKR